MNNRKEKAGKKETDAHETGPGRALLPLPLPPPPLPPLVLPLPLPWLDADDGDGVVFVTGDPPCAECRTISRLPRGGDAERECIRSSSAGLVECEGGDRVDMGGRPMLGGAPCPASPAPIGRG